MLNTQQIQQLKLSASPTAQNSQVLTPEEAKASFVTPKPVSGYEVAMGMKNPDSTPNTDKGIIPETVDQFKSGFEQTKEGGAMMSKGDILGGLQQVGRGTLNEMWAGLRAVFSPVEAGLKVVSKLPGFHQALGALQDHVINPTANAISDNKHIQDFMQSNPHADEVFGNLLGIVSSVVGGKVAPETKGLISDAGTKIADTSSNLLNKISDTTGNIGNKIKESLPSTASKTPFEQSLSDAEQSIYPKLSPTEKANVTLKDKSGILGKKSVPDLINNPKTKPIIESVANLPEDIQLKPSDTLAIKESKLNQGINRLHSDTEGMLNQPTVKAQTAFNDVTFNKYMKDNVLSKIEKEFGKNSVEYKATQKAIKTAKSSIESNDAHGVYTGRQKFSSIWESENPRTFKKAKGSFGSQLDPQTTATVEAGRDVYNALNDFNENLLPENHPLRPRMREESNLIKAKSEMRTRSTGEIDKNPVTRALDRNPIIKKGVKTATGILKVGTGVDIINHL